MEVSFVVLIQLLIATVQAVPNLNRILCDGTEVCLLGSVQFNISCSCPPSSIYCFWTTFANRSDILIMTNGTSESLQLVWHSNTLGYGQFTCISRNSSSDNVERNVLIIPNVQGTNCDGCINTTICTSTTGQCLLQFSKLFNVNSQCELYFLNGTRYVDTFTEGMHVELHRNFSYYILCFTPTCPNLHREIYYEIPTSKIRDCSNSDLCSQLPTTTADMFTISVSDSTTTLSSFSLSSFLPSISLILSTDVTTVTPTNTDSTMTLSSFLMSSILLPNVSSTDIITVTTTKTAISLISSTDITTVTPTKTDSNVTLSSIPVSLSFLPNTSSTDIITTVTPTKTAILDSTASFSVSSSFLSNTLFISSTDIISTVTPTKSGGLITSNENNKFWTTLGGVIGAIIFVILLVIMITVILLCYLKFISQRKTLKTNDVRAASPSTCIQNVMSLQDNLPVATRNIPGPVYETIQDPGPACQEISSDQNRKGPDPTYQGLSYASHSRRANISKPAGDVNNDQIIENPSYNESVV